MVDVCLAPEPEITEYQRVSKVCSCCGAVSTPGWDETGDEYAEVVGAGGRRCGSARRLWLGPRW